MVSGSKNHSGESHSAKSRAAGDHATARVVEMPSPARRTEQQGPPVRASLRPTIGMVVFLLAAIGLTIGGCFAAKYWPYRYREIQPLLEDVFGSQVKIASYHRTYLPHPGFMASGITLTRKSAPDQPPLGTVETLFVQGTWHELLLLQRRVRLVDMTRLHISVPPVGSQAMKEDFPAGSASGFSGPDTAVEVMRIHNSLLEVQRQNTEPLRFTVREVEIRNLKKHQAMHYALQMENPIPSGSIQASGSFGPLNSDNVGATTVSGAFTFNQVKLSDVGDLHGTLSSSGRFSGMLRAIEADASSQTPDFAVGNGKATSIRGTIHCIINGLNGDVMMPDVEVTSGRTTVRVHGQVAGSPKITNLDVAVDGGRVEDVLRPFIHKQVPVLGPVVLHSHAYIGPSGKPFLERLQVDGRFDVPAERMTNRSTEQKLSSFSERAQGKKESEQKSDDKNAAPDALSSLSGPAVIAHGVISTQGLKFQVPGAEANLRGTFTIEGEVAHFTGNLSMQTDISHTTTGIKSILLKPFAPLFEKHHEGAVIPIAVVGKGGNYHVTQDLTHTK
jgi:hypothetical protein